MCCRRRRRARSGVVPGQPRAAALLESATGAYAGRAGSVRVSGGNDVKNFPNELIQDDFWVIELR